jgi:hypothetical protein
MSTLAEFAEFELMPQLSHTFLVSILFEGLYRHFLLYTAGESHENQGKTMCLARSE